ncbi:FAD:protein FMN transferase [Novosphingobium album (ex Hu et al. 2023)]|uniref:FAD:protein FMN transferase n=1 Tax=Novosphingobium album (ex Hu et al. 2023) TaxID=2930093 RepID=A0ABT0AZR3_9SPHN|nr:FAD:protein FMN transferase [Novosphingobium album (ex Hu et al. 2023)]MCJ2178301.1 FAD:protein FMN transferase [Novosphingobium album (ex Hu et al. 2023)]
MRLAVPLEIDAAVLAGWRRDAPLAELRGETMGTVWSVRMACPPELDSAGVAEAITARLEEILAQMSHWRADSVLGRFNRAPGGAWFVLPPDFARVMEAGLAVAACSGGAFDPAIGELVNLWGHGPVSREAPPGRDELAAARTRAGWQRLAYEPETRRLRQPGGLQLDLSGIAKGFAVDALAQLLRGRGCHHALVEIGGELVGMGMRPDGDPWWVDLETPESGIAPFRVALHQLAVATSGDYVRGRHTIDPRTGLPVEHAMAVSVIHEEAILADVWATALGVLPPDEMQALASSEGLCVRALVRRDGSVVEWISPALEALVCEVGEEAL